jgi:hypothetical protein
MFEQDVKRCVFFPRYVGVQRGQPVRSSSSLLYRGEAMKTSMLSFFSIFPFFPFPLSFPIDYRSPFEATVVSRLRSSGALLVGKTNMDEFGMGFVSFLLLLFSNLTLSPLYSSANAHSHFGPTLNPSHPSGLDSFEQQTESERRVPGGSSGGSAAAVAAGTCDLCVSSRSLLSAASHAKPTLPPALSPRIQEDRLVFRRVIAASSGSSLAMVC